MEEPPVPWVEVPHQVKMDPFELPSYRHEVLCLGDPPDARAGGRTKRWPKTV